MNNLSNKVQNSIDVAIGILWSSIWYASLNEYSSTIISLGKTLEDVKIVYPRINNIF
jgi:hypothetical protein